VTLCYEIDKTGVRQRDEKSPWSDRESFVLHLEKGSLKMLCDIITQLCDDLLHASTGTGKNDMMHGLVMSLKILELHLYKITLHNVDRQQVSFSHQNCIDFNRTENEIWCINMLIDWSLG
jgi:hypothetical protein